MPGSAQDRSPRDELEQLTEPLAEAIADNMRNAEVYDTNGFHVESSEVGELGADLKPNGIRFQMLSVTADGTFRASVEKGRSISAGGGVAIFHRDSGQPLLSTGDSDGDGSLDALSYATVDQDGKVLVQVTDYEADGQPDIRINFAESYVELWHLDRWHRVENRNGRRGVVLDGDFVELSRENNRLIIP